VTGFLSSLGRKAYISDGPFLRDEVRSQKIHSRAGTTLGGWSMKIREKIEGQHKERVRGLFKAIDRHDFDTFKSLFVSEGICHIAGIPQALNVEVGISFIKKFYEGFPDGVHFIEDIVAEGNKVAVRFVLQGTHKEEFSGIAPSGNPIRSEGIHVYHFFKGKVKEMWIVEDKLSLMHQLGLELKPKEEKK
jgi:predicted ester cyclase